MLRYNYVLCIMYHALFVICIYIPISCIAFGIKYYYSPGQNIDLEVSGQIGDNTFAHIPDERLHDCAQFTCNLVLRLRTLPFQYICIIYYICAYLKFYASSENYCRHLYLYD